MSHFDVTDHIYVEMQNHRLTRLYGVMHFVHFHVIYECISYFWKCMSEAL